MHAFCSIDQFGQFLQNILHMNIQISNEHLRHEYIRIDHFVLSSIHSWARSIVKHPQCRCDAEVLNQEKYICQKVHNVSPDCCGFSAKHLKPSNIYNITKTRPKGLEKSAKMGDRDGRHCCWIRPFKCSIPINDAKISLMVLFLFLFGLGCGDANKHIRCLKLQWSNCGQLRSCQDGEIVIYFIKDIINSQ